VQRILPPGVELVTYRGVRVVTPFAAVHRVPVVAAVTAQLEGALVASPLRYFGGFLIAILRRTS
jgi:hypothetical protein